MPRETSLWTASRQDRAAGPDAEGIAAGTRRFWNSATPEGRAGALGDWLGQRIAAAWYARHQQDAVVLHRLIRQRTAPQLLEESDYAPGAAQPGSPH